MTTTDGVELKLIISVSQELIGFSRGPAAQGELVLQHKGNWCVMRCLPGLRHLLQGCSPLTAQGTAQLFLVSVV